MFFLYIETFSSRYRSIVSTTKHIRTFFLYYYIGTVFLLFLSSRAVLAQSNCLFDHYSTEDGLSHGSITDIIKDSYGFIWLGTMDGINRFDGFNFRTYKTRPGDKVSLSSNRIFKIREDKYGFLWVRTYDSKIYRFNKSSELFQEVVTDAHVTHIFLAASGDVWLISVDSGAYRIITDPISLDFKLEHFHENSIKNRIPCNQVKLIAENIKDKIIWLGTGKGIVAFDFNDNIHQYTKHRFTPLDSMMIQHKIFTSYVVYDSAIFLGTSNGELFEHIPEDGFSRLPLNTKAQVSVLRIMGGRFLVIGTLGNGIFKYDIQHRKLADNLKPDLVRNIYKIFIDAQENIWMEVDEPGVAKVNCNLKKLRHFCQEKDFSVAQDMATQCSFALDNKGILWVSLKGTGFGYYNSKNDSFEYFYNKPGDVNRKMSNFVTTFLIDDIGTLWLSTYSKGIEKVSFTETHFHHLRNFNPSHRIVSNEVRSIFENNSRELYLGTKGGDLYKLNANYSMVQQINDLYPLHKSLIYSVSEDSENNICIGTKGNGLFIIKPNPDTSTPKYVHDICNGSQYSLNNNNIYSVIEDSKQRLWIATYGGGINLLYKNNDRDNFRNFNNSFFYYPKNEARKLRQAIEDTNGNIWLASTNGLVFFNPNSENPDSTKFFYYKKVPGDITSLGNNNILCLHIDKKGTLWIGTLGGGLQKLVIYPDCNTTPQFKTYTRDEGLSSDVVLSITSDDNNNLWMSTENGLTFFNPINGQFRNFDEYEGLAKTTFSESASCLRASGEIVFGTYDGIVYFNPDKVSAQKDTVNLQITGFSIFNHEDIAYHKILANSNENPLELKYNENMFKVDYVGLNVIAQHKITYAYILEGLDDSWHYVKSERTATYTNISPGHYVFKVKVTNPELISLNDWKELHILIEPPYWKTKMAYVIYGILLIIAVDIIRRIIFSFIRLRNKIVIDEEMTNLKLRFFTNISHELRTPLMLIVGPIEEIAKNEPLSNEGKEYLRMMDKNAQRMLRLVNQLLDFRKLQNNKMRLKVSKVEIVNFITEIASSFQELAKQKKISFNIYSNVDQFYIWMDMEKFDIVIFNLLSNAFKFTPEGKKIDILIECLIEKPYVTVQIADQGIGIPKEKVSQVFFRFNSFSTSGNLRDNGTGIGLSLSKELIDMHCGTLTFESQVKKGTVFTVKLKTGNSHFNSDITDFMPERKDGDNLSSVVQIGNRKFTTAAHERINKDEKSELPKLLIVEDDSDLRQFIVLNLRHDYQIFEALNGKDGLQIARECLPDIIVSDIMMPVMDGIELIHQVRSRFEISHIPIILLSAKSTLDDKINGLQYGADDYLTKPFSCEYLKVRIDNILKTRKKLFTGYSESKKIEPDNEMVLTSRDEKFLSQVLQVLEENYNNPEFKIELLAREIGVGRTKFFTKLKSLTGTAPIEMLKEFRLKKSLDLLKGDNNVSEVAFMVGFNDAGYFTKCFKEKYGTTPSKYFLK
jgi:signal transduction histidine kinase/DNA-binding response OmpR family regulator/ligand-binding sensor domain-containing protein